MRLAAPYDPDSLDDLLERFGSPLLVIDCDVIRRQYAALAAALPGVDLHYALKPLPDIDVVRTLAALGSGFDLATSGEVELVRRAGVDPGRCIHTHPIKREGDIRDALEFGVRTFVADNPDELRKFRGCADRVELLIRVSFRSPAAVVDLSRKFGCDPEAAPGLIGQAREAGIRVAGLSFHVGSQSRTPDTKVRAIEVCTGILRRAASSLSAPPVLDIGGGFPIDYLEPASPIDAFCEPIRTALRGLPEGTRILAEPGRFICGPAGTILTTVMGRAWRDGRWWYYLDDGLYGSFSGQLYDHARYPVAPLRDKPGPRFHSVLAGPTCDSIDVVREDIELPELEAGDVIVGRQMGAYTVASATDFNFFPRARTVVVNR
ncbi:MAG: ornithine decarboxylase [Gammaproteobacteria bacterium SG8_30]|nr:MAG: ornithine decarboxylase [Gammaproteobacteria bacterium SG8_30]